MLFIPAIDLIGGRCVRLHQGDFERKVQYEGDPVEVARGFRDEGAKALHVVDLDAARDGGGEPGSGGPGGRAGNLRVIERIAKESGIPVETGGGVRGRERIRALLGAGVRYVVLGTVLVKEPELTRELVREFGGSLVAGIDARDGVVRISGWTESGGLPALEAGMSALRMGFTRVIYTDIARDGTLEGPNLAELKAMAVRTGLEVTASGGVSSLEDLERIKSLEPFGVTGVIAGKAIYEGKLSVRDACRLLQNGA
jgi:phosphoribosylformimino-5-aminoimidazole carboxamide ribotide isomerase